MEDGNGPHLATALDGDGSPVDSVTSDFGHLLGTGLLSHEEEALLADRIAGPDLDAGHSLRTLSSEAAGYNPDARLPELFAGHGTDEARYPAACPASCRPQA